MSREVIALKHHSLETITDERFYQELGVRIREARIYRTDTIARAAEDIGVTTRTFSKYEKGQSQISPWKLLLLCYRWRVCFEFIVEEAASAAGLYDGVDFPA